MSGWCKSCDRKQGQGQCSLCYKEREYPAALGARDRGARKVPAEAQRVHAVALKRSRGVPTTSIASPTKIQAHGVTQALTPSPSPDRAAKASAVAAKAVKAPCQPAHAVASSNAVPPNFSSDMASWLANVAEPPNSSSNVSSWLSQAAEPLNSSVASAIRAPAASKKTKALAVATALLAVPPISSAAPAFSSVDVRAVCAVSVQHTACAFTHSTQANSSAISAASAAPAPTFAFPSSPAFVALPKISSAVATSAVASAPVPAVSKKKGGALAVATALLAVPPISSAVSVISEICVCSVCAMCAARVGAEFVL
jgi:hypothetical protein